MMQITDVILIALFIEAVVDALKPIWSTSGEKLSISEYVSMGMGVLLAVTCRINMLAYVVDIAYPAWVEYVFFTLTGIAIGRGTNFVYDLWNKLKEWQSGKLIEEEIEGVNAMVEGDVADIKIENWSLTKLRDFCMLNGIDTTGCTTRQDYIDAIAGKRTVPPDDGGAKE